MTRFVLAALLVTCPFAAEAAPDAAQISTMCGTRSTCTIGKTHDGGKSPQGLPLTVVEVHLGVQDKPGSAPDDGCRTPDDQRDGGVEYWLIDGSAAPKQLLALCNDGYGSAGMGEDEVKVGPNRLVHEQSGGSDWRFRNTYTFTLSPWRLVNERERSFNDTMEFTGTTVDIDYVSMTARSIAMDRTNKDPLGWPEWPADAGARFTPEPAAGVLGAYDVIAPYRGSESNRPEIPRGTVIGDCVAAMTTAGANGFVVFGTPAGTKQAAEIRVVAETMGSLLIQVFDPAATEQPAPTEGSWINLPHFEIWVGHNESNLFTRLPLADLSQIGVDLDGRIYQGVGKRTPLPSVDRWTANDAGRPAIVLRVRWADSYALLDGVAVVYSQAQAGRQARLVATTGVVDNRPLYVPQIASVGNTTVDPPPGSCRVDKGTLSKSE